ncbi:MAG TPA: transglutaminase family protein [Candidatus Thermoplasmatota archaeon]|nr:transglutaminase family protein [Candidatus Thermoplasmatota archaeon]
MLTPWEIKQKEMIPTRHMLQMNIGGVFFLFKVLLLNLGTFKMLKNPETKNVYVRPAPSYILPPYSSEMKSHISEEKYLRPTLFCNCQAPEIIALAHQLGAYQKTDREYAEAAFEFAKRKIILEQTPLDDVTKILHRGTGTCLHKISVFIALCRAAGLPARYKFFALTLLDEFVAPSLEHAPLIKQWSDAMGYFLLHGAGEVYLDGKWITADVGAEPTRQASTWIPITKLGEDGAGLWLFPIPGSTIIRESIPLGLGIPSRILMHHLVPNSVVGLNIGILEQIEKGKKIIEEAGGEAAYDAEARSRRKQASIKNELLKKHDSIVFEGD